MSVGAAEYLDAAVHLPSGETLTLSDVRWEEYERLVYELGDSAGLRVSFDRGRLQIMSPSAKHEKYKILLNHLVYILCDELQQDMIGLGSVTLQRQLKGAEPDDCFYTKSAPLIAGKDSLDLAIDPPPDLVVEIDITSQSVAKLKIYSAFGVPEIWRYDGNEWRILELRNQSYQTVPFSILFPFLSGEQIVEFIANSERGSCQAHREFREWIRSAKPTVQEN